jgi:DNA-binding GntR family transcriptional regulator
MTRVTGVAELVRVGVLRGDLAAGELLVEPKLAERLRVGRATLREALRLLEGRGLLVSHDGSLYVPDMDEPALVATLQARSVLEALSAGLAAERVRDGRAGDALGRLEVLAASEADRAFHRAVDDLGDNAACRDALDGIWDRLLLAEAQGVVRLRPGDHAELTAAIAAGDAPDASELARRHVLAALA